MKIGLIREGKNPPDERVPLAPWQCRELMDEHENIDIIVQNSRVRRFKDESYKKEGVKLVQEVSEAEILMGVKEVPIDQLIPNKTYFFFSHTIKKQPYNRDLLKAVLEKNIRLIDYEVLTDEKGNRLIGFGRYAGIVGAYNALRAYGLRTGTYDLKKAHSCEDKQEMEDELRKVRLPDDFKIVLTGLGRVSKGAAEILEKNCIKEVSSHTFLEEKAAVPSFARLGVEKYNEKMDGSDFTRQDFYKDPIGYRSTFMQYAHEANMYIACHYWDSKSPFIFTREDARSEQWNIEVVADISCDIDGPVASTIRPSTIADPVYGYDPVNETETAFNAEDAITVMAVDNLPCELPKDASADFGAELIKNIFPALLNGDKDNILKRATIAENGRLTSNFIYLQDYVDGVGVE